MSATRRETRLWLALLIALLLIYLSGLYVAGRD